MPIANGSAAGLVVRDKMRAGFVRVSVPTWGAFVDYLSATFLDRPNYIFRGHAISSWKLEPTLDRILRAREKRSTVKARARHLLNFKYAARGRRGPNPALLVDENDWWALGQHQGLATPLLDWSKSPYVAAFFAFASESVPNNDTRVVFALSQVAVEKTNALVKSSGAEESTVTFVRPLSDENARLVNQGGLFTRSPDGATLESWVETHCQEFPTSVLHRMEIPDAGRLTFLRNLNRMNINHLTLFPDLFGAGTHCNFDLAIDKY